MIPVKATTNGAFGKRLEERIQKWASQRTTAARIRTPAELDWWHHQEFGTAPYKMKPDPLGIFHDQWAAIWRRDAKALAFTHNGVEVVTERVLHHPGIPARHMVGDAMPLIQEKGAEKLRQLAPSIPDNPHILQQFVVDAATQAKEIITDSFELTLSDNPRSDGRLEGKTAAEVFADKAKIVTQE